MSRSSLTKRCTGAPSKLAGLSEVQLGELIRWLHIEKITYTEAIKRIRQQFGIQTSLGGLSRFYGRVLSPRILETLRANDGQWPAISQPATSSHLTSPTEIVIETANPEAIRFTVTKGSQVSVRVQTPPQAKT